MSSPVLLLRLFLKQPKKQLLTPCRALNHQMYVSTVVLVMDYCFNPDEPRARERKEEIKDCFRLLESGHDGSTMATRGLQKLGEILYGKRAAQKNTSGSAPAAANMDHPPSSPLGSPETRVPTQAGFDTALPVGSINAGHTFGNVNDVSTQSLPDFNHDSSLVNWDINIDVSVFDELLQNMDYTPETFYINQFG